MEYTEFEKLKKIASKIEKKNPQIKEDIWKKWDLCYCFEENNHRIGVEFCYYPNKRNRNSEEGFTTHFTTWNKDDWNYFQGRLKKILKENLNPQYESNGNVYLFMSGDSIHDNLNTKEEIYRLNKYYNVLSELAQNK